MRLYSVKTIRKKIVDNVFQYLLIIFFASELLIKKENKFVVKKIFSNKL